MNQTLICVTGLHLETFCSLLAIFSQSLQRWLIKTVSPFGNVEILSICNQNLKNKHFLTTSVLESQYGEGTTNVLRSYCSSGIDQVLEAKGKVGSYRKSVAFLEWWEKKGRQGLNRVFLFIFEEKICLDHKCGVPNSLGSLKTTSENISLIGKSYIIVTANIFVFYNSSTSLQCTEEPTRPDP